MSRSFLLLANPVSGGGRAPATAARLAGLLADGGADAQVETSRDPVHARSLVPGAVAAGRIVVAVGGDGMAASVAGAVVAAEGTLGICPGGRGNDFARMLGMPTDLAAVAGVLLGSEPRAVDVISTEPVEGGEPRVVLGSMYSGVDSLASQIVDRSRRMPTGMQYPYAALRSLLSFRPREFTVTVDGREHRQRAYTVVVANSAYYGQGMMIAPTAEVDDGILDVVVLPASSRTTMVRTMPKVYDGRHLELDGVTVLSGRTVTVRAEVDGPTGEAVAAYGDGELLGPLPRTATVMPAALTVVAPG